MKEPLNDGFMSATIVTDGRHQTVHNVVNLLMDYKLEVIYRYIEIDNIEFDLKNGKFPEISEVLSTDVYHSGGWLTITIESNEIQYTETYASQRIIQS